jgi:uncharacterized membrane protein YeiH
MQNHQTISIIFIAISVIFVGIAFRDYLNAENKMTIRRKIWIRMAFIFAAVGIVLFFAQIFLR